MKERPRAVAVAALIVAASTSPASSVAQKDYEPHARSWNGLSRFLELAEDGGVYIETPDAVDVSHLGPGDALLIVCPSESLPVDALSSFVEAGGRLALADDFGSGEALLSMYGIRRRSSTQLGASTLRGNPALPVAEPRAVRHPLARGVRAVVANHPSVVQHDKLRPLFGFGRQDAALVLAGAVERGRFVVVSDPSVFINNMLQFRGNRRFARNLLGYLDGGRGGRVVLVSRDAVVSGQRTFTTGGPVRRVRRWLAGIASARTPPLALQLGSVLLLALFVLVTVSSLPRHSPYQGTWMLPRPAPAGGFVGRIAFFRQRPTNLIYPLMVYKHELEMEIVRKLGLAGRSTTRDIVAAARDRGLPAAEVERLHRLLGELDDLRQQQDRPPSPPRVGRARFRRLVRAGEHVLRLLEDDRSERDPQ